MLFIVSFTACFTCRIQKSTQATHPKTAGRGAVRQRLQLTSTDLLGPIYRPAIGDLSDVAKFTDHCTLLKAVYFLKQKSEVVPSVVPFVPDVGIPLGLRVQRLPSDQGGENVSAAIGSCCTTTGIVQQFSTPRTLERNGVFERDGCTIMAMMRFLLHEAHLPQNPWGEISSTAVFLINRIIHLALSGELCAFACLANKRISLLCVSSLRMSYEEGHTSKLQPKAWEGVLSGNDDKRPTFRAYNRTTQQVLSSRNVTFIEPVPELPAFTMAAQDEDIDIIDQETIAEGITSLGTKITAQTFRGTEVQRSRRHRIRGILSPWICAATSFFHQAGGDSATQLQKSFSSLCSSPAQLRS